MPTITDQAGTIGQLAPLVCVDQSRFQRRTYTVTEAAHVLGISRSTAYELVASGDLPAVRLGHRWVVPIRAVDELLGPRSYDHSSGRR